MSEQNAPHKASWATPVDRLKVSGVPEGATNLNVEGRQITSPLQGFGPLWQKTYRIRLEGLDMPAEEVMQVWRENFPQFQPAGNKFYPPITGVQAGEVMFIESAIAPRPGLPGIPVSSGVLILFIDETNLSVATPEGFPESGWNTFSVFEQDGTLWAQVQSLARTADPVFEFGFRFMGGSRFQEETWRHVLRSLAEHFGIADQEVTMQKVCVDPQVQWSGVRNVWHNAMLRSMAYMPLRYGRALGRRLRSGR